MSKSIRNSLVCINYSASLTFRFDLNLPNTGLSFGPSSFFFGAMKRCATGLFHSQILRIGCYSHDVCLDGNAPVIAVCDSALVHRDLISTQEVVFYNMLRC